MSSLYFSIFLSIFQLSLLLFSPAPAVAGELMFEGYYKVELKGLHIGYSIQRYEYEPKTKTFGVLTFLNCKIGESLMQESLKATANDQFKPISYQYTSQVGTELKGIDATFSGEIMKLQIREGTKPLRNETHKLPKSTFLSSFLPYLLLKQKIKVNEAFKYSAIAEEDGASYWGKTWFVSNVDKDLQTIFSIRNKFKGEEFDSTMVFVKDGQGDRFVQGEVLGSFSEAKGLKSTLVADPTSATKGFTLPQKTLLALFGTVPTGKANLLSKTPRPTSGP